MTVDVSSDSVERLVELLDQQCGIYQQLRDLSEQQSRLVAEGDAESLLTLLNQRQALIDRLLQINEQIEPFKQRWSQFWSELDASQQGRIRERMDAVQSLLDGIMAQDEKDREALAAQRTRVGEQLGQVSRGANVNRAYGQASNYTVNTRFTDQQG
jgi:flagellar biosynthesis/type III secretory pathway chaperone